MLNRIRAPKPLSQFQTAGLKLSLCLSLIGASALLLSGCAPANRAAEIEADNQEVALESGVTAMNGLLDDQSSTNGFASNRSSFKPTVTSISEMILPQAHAAVCTRAIAQVCSGSTKSITYSGCTGPNGLVSLSGQVNLVWSGNGNCTLENGEAVSRTYELEFNGPRGGVLSVSSSNKSTWEGNSIGGGGSLSQISANSWALSIAGKHKTLVYRNREIFDISVATASPISVTGSLLRNGRVVNGGSLVVYHNRAGFTATFVPNNLTYSAGSCHPVSGSVNVTYTGSLVGNATVTFNGNGNATITRDGISRSVTLTYCE